jgi:hypothetical protein
VTVGFLIGLIDSLIESLYTSSVEVEQILLIKPKKARALPFFLVGS